jgi:hypothetical protein
VFNLAKVIDNSVVDGGITISTNYFEDEYEMRDGFKRLVFRNGVPYGFNKILNQEVRFWCLHCQGDSKGVMPLLQRPGFRAYFRQLYRLKRFTGALKHKSGSYVQGALKRLVRRSSKGNVPAWNDRR